MVELGYIARVALYIFKPFSICDKNSKVRGDAKRRREKQRFSDYGPII